MQQMAKRMNGTMFLSLLLALAAPAGQSPAQEPASFVHPGAAEAPASSPETYPDPEGFERRKMIILRGLAAGGLDRWRRGYFSGGDPGKYLPGHAMAKLLLNPDDPEPAQYMNDERSYKEHYHFAAVNWARFYPLFGERVLTEETRRKFANAAAAYGSYLRHGGTENHKTMWWSSANVLPHYVRHGQFSGMPRDQALQEAKERLRQYVSGLFDAGAGEWDSSTYYPFTFNGLMNIYDFSPDEEARLLAKAGLDLLIAGYALKYTDGIFCAPNQRGWTDRAWRSLADHTGYLWFGAPIDPDEKQAFDFRYTLHAITSRYRPNAVLTRLARKDVPTLPVTQYNRKGNYWHGQNIAPALAAHETVHLGRHFTMGSLWDAHASQHTRFQIVVRTDGAPLAFFAGHPRRSDHTGKKTDIGYADGTGRYVQSAQIGATAVVAARIPDDDEADHIYFRFPEGFAPRPAGDVWVVETPRAIIVIYPFGGEAAIGRSLPFGKNNERIEIFQVRGRHPGMILEGYDREEIAEGLEAWLAKHPTPNADLWGTDGMLSFRLRDGREATFRFNPDPDGDRHGDRLAEVTIEGRAFALQWPWVWGGPLVRLENRVLQVSDGRDGFVVDFTGSLPRYRRWQP